MPQSAALALYKGPVSDFPKDGPLSHEQPIDAFVYGDSAHMPSENLTETLIPGRKPFKLTERWSAHAIQCIIVAFVYYSICLSMFVCCSFQTAGVRASRCGVTEWTRDPGLFVTRPRSPGKPNDCIWFQSCPLNISRSWFHVAKQNHIYYNFLSLPCQVQIFRIPHDAYQRTVSSCHVFKVCLVVSASSTAAGRSYPAIHSDMDFLLNEINTDCIGGAEDEEFIEFWHPSGFRMSLDFIWLVMINGQTGTVYYELELNGYFTDDDGYFLVSSCILWHLEMWNNESYGWIPFSSMCQL